MIFIRGFIFAVSCVCACMCVCVFPSFFSFLFPVFTFIFVCAHLFVSSGLNLCGCVSASVVSMCVNVCQ